MTKKLIGPSTVSICKPCKICGSVLANFINLHCAKLVKNEDCECIGEKKIVSLCYQHAGRN